MPTHFRGPLYVGGVPTVGGGGLIPTTTGKYFYVHSGTGSNGNPGDTADQPFATMAYANSMCVATRCDVVICLPGHAEVIAGPAGILCTSGVTFVGIGTGTFRPAITWSATDATITANANVTFRNFQCLASIDAVVKHFLVQSIGFHLDAVDFVETASVASLAFLHTSATGNDMTIQNCYWSQTVTAATALSQWILLNGSDRTRIVNNFANIKGFATSNPANGIVVGVTTESLNLLIADNNFISTNSTGAIVISLLANSTGFVVRNNVASAKTAIAGQVACAAAYASQNFANNTVNVSGLLDPVVDS